jgi:hypothetical protein
MRFLAAALAALGVAGCATQPNMRADQVGETVVGQAIARGKDAACMENLRQIRAAIQAVHGGADAPPPALAGLRLPAQVLACPIGRAPYVYDAATGTVSCPHPGHGGY